MRLLITGASGNVGTAVLHRLTSESTVDGIEGLCRRPPPPVPPYDQVRWHAADLSGAGSAAVLAEAVSGVDAVVHLVWQLQGARQPRQSWRTNVLGTQRVAEAAAEAGVRHLVYASSVGAYSPGPGQPVDEQWPTEGVASSAYSRQKVEVEAWLDGNQERLGLSVARLRPALIFQPAAGSELGRYFGGPLYHPRLFQALGRLGLPLLPLPSGLTVQAVHADDVADAVWRILDRRASGPFNLAAEPLTGPQLAALAGTRHLPLPPALLRAALSAAFHARLTPTDPGWLDLALAAPVLDTGRARHELGWAPTRSSRQALTDAIRGLADGAGTASPALHPQHHKA